MKRFLRLFFAFSFSLFTYFCSAQYTTLLTFTGSNGEFPSGGLILSGNVLYGTTGGGGITGDTMGNIFSIYTDGAGYKQLFVFNGPNGEYPGNSSLTLSGGILYGATTGGNITAGSIFAVDTNGNNFKDLLDFNDTNGYSPAGTLIISGNVLYGAAFSGGAHNGGCVFSIHIDGTGYKDLFDFDGTNGAGCQGPIILGNLLYGMTTYGGANSKGTIFSIDTDGAKYKDIFDFGGGSNGSEPFGNLTFYGNKFYGMTAVGGPNSYGNIFSIDTNGNDYKDLFDFHGTYGEEPFGSLIISGSVLYGMAQHGGTDSNGCIFCIDTDGSGYKDLYDFTIYGEIPGVNLTLSGDMLYGLVDNTAGRPNDGILFSFKDTNGGLGVNELKNEIEEARIYPNPNNGNFTLEYDLGAGVSGKVVLYNTLGQKMGEYSLLNSQGKMNISNPELSNGVYIWKLYTTNQVEQFGKIVIMK